MKRTLLCVALMISCGCRDDGAPTPPLPGAEALESSSPAGDRPTEVEMVAAMEAHYGVVILAHDALLQGDLDTFRAQLALVPAQQLPPTSPPAWIPLHDRLREAAGEAANARDLDAAADAAAQVVLACGGCHAALGTGPIYPAPAPDDGTDVVQEAMLDHQWVTERLWEGVTGPWDDAWQRGANALAEVQVFGDLGAEAILSEELIQREQALRELGQEAKRTTALDERAALYGQLLSTCGDCHRAAGVKFDKPL